MNSNKGKINVFSGQGNPLEMQLHEIPGPKMGEVLVENLYTTLCGSDLHTFCGLRQEKTPTVLGHEIVGRVIELGEGHQGTDQAGDPLRPGDVITWSIYAVDPESDMAKAGIPQKGAGLFKYGHAMVTGADCFHGGLGEYCILKPYTAILKVPGYIPIPVAATLNCAIATVAGGLRLAGTIADKNVLITGAGMLGIVCAAMCRDAGAKWVDVADIDPARLEKAMRFGADRTFLLAADQPAAEPDLKTIHAGKGADLVFDMSGSPEAMELGLECLGTGGTAVWIGAVFPGRELRLSPESLIRKLHCIKGLHNYNYVDFTYALDFLKRNVGKYPFTTVVEKEFPLSRAQEAFEYAIANKPLRVGINISGTDPSSNPGSR